ncbi:MAG: hypothetical protein KKI08_12490, partial [Armatimonadetes bacterium]|nr:hypothetical protein [Armatimonadota bacterium]
RYSRASQKLAYIIDNCLFLGQQADPERPHAMLVAVWAPPSTGKGSGLYACFRIRFTEDQATSAILYCFYDGTDGSPSLKSAETAFHLARKHGFEAP